MMPVWTYTIKCQSKHYYNFQNTTIEGIQYAIIFSLLSQTVSIFEKTHKSTQNDNPNDGWQLLAASEMHFLLGEDMLIYSWAMGMRHTREVPAGGVNFTCETERVQRKMLERLRFIFHPQSALPSCPNQKVGSLLPRKKGPASCSRKKGCLGANQSKWSLLVLFLYPLERCHNYNIIYIYISYINVIVMLLYITLYSNKVRERTRQENHQLSYLACEGAVRYTQNSVSWVQSEFKWYWSCTIPGSSRHLGSHRNTCMWQALEPKHDYKMQCWALEITSS